MFRALTVIVLLAAASGADALTLRSKDITDGEVVPRAQIYPRCGGDNISPQLEWSGVPRETRSLALTMIDVDVKPAEWSHWLVVDIPPATSALPRGTRTLPVGAHGIESNFGGTDYNGPCPPAGSGIHHYRFAIWALAVPHVALAPDEPASEVEAVLAKQSLGNATLTGLVRR